MPIPQPKYKVPINFGQPQEMVVDLVVKVGNTFSNYNGLPASAEIADTYYNGDSVVISDNREAMNAEILNYKQKSIDIVNSIDLHKSIIVGCDEILQNLNPEFAEKQQQQAELSELRQQVQDISKNMMELMSVNKSLMEHLNGKDIKNE